MNTPNLCPKLTGIKSLRCNVRHFSELGFSPKAAPFSDLKNCNKKRGKLPSFSLLEIWGGILSPWKPWKNSRLVDIAAAYDI